MAGESVGQIYLDLGINASQMSKQITQAADGATKQASSAFSGLGKKIMAGLGVAAIAKFTKSCLDLGSNLTEVQNVVDTAFGGLSAQADTWAKNAMNDFGMSETSAKKYMGVFGQMSSAMGITGKSALDMSEKVTGLTGDVASFYNISQDEAYTKLKSIWTGETESLKDLGVVMTQTNLDQYALNNGFGKTTSAMTEQEKVMLRYQYVTSALSNASGDFMKTQDSWANQTRVLSLRFEQLKATLGQGFIALFTPIVRGINKLLAGLQKLADGFVKLTELITGASIDVDTSPISSDIADIGSSATDAADNISGIGSSTKDAVKEAEKALMGFDSINKLTAPVSDDAGTATNAGGASSGPGLGSIASGEVDKANQSLDGMAKTVEKLKDLLNSGFKKGLGDDFNDSIERSRQHLVGIKDSLIDIFTDQGVVSSAKNLGAALIYNVGVVSGSALSIGQSIAENLLGGIDKYLDQNKGYIKSKIVSILDAKADMVNKVGELSSAIAEIFEVFRGDDAKQCTADLIAIFANSSLGIEDLISNLMTDVVTLISDPIIKNKDKIKQALEETFKPISTVLDTVSKAVTDTFTKVQQMYDAHISPLFSSISDGISEIIGKVLDVYNTYIAPVLQNLANAFSTNWTQYIQPTINAAIDLIGKVADLINAMWTNILQPLIEWLVENILPVIGPIIEGIGTIVIDLFASISELIHGLLDMLSGVIDFLTGVFTGDWSKAWDGIKEIFKGLIESVFGIFKGIMDLLIDTISSVFDTISGVFSAAWDNVSSIWSVLADFFSGVWDGACHVFDNVVDFFGGVFSSAWDAVCHAFDGVSSFFGSLWNSITSTFTNIGSSIGSAVSDSFRAALNGVFGIVEGTVNKFIRMINGAIGVINNIPGVSIGRLDSIHIPKLAQGGYVKANTPQLAMIGDNRHQGEVVAPEDKLKAMAQEAASMGGNATLLAEAVQILKMILKVLQELDIDFEIDGMSLKKYIVQKINDNTKATGKCEIIT